MLIKWILHFEQNIPVFVKIPIVLVYKGCENHYSTYIMTKSMVLEIILILLPEDSTHLVHPLDIVIFTPL